MSPSATARNRGAAPLVASNRCTAIMLPIGAMMSSGADNLVELPTVPFRIRARWRSEWSGWLARQGTQMAEGPCQLTDLVEEILEYSRTLSQFRVAIAAPGRQPLTSHGRARSRPPTARRDQGTQQAGPILMRSRCAIVVRCVVLSTSQNGYRRPSARRGSYARRP